NHGHVADDNVAPKIFSKNKNRIVPEARTDNLPNNIHYIHMARFDNIEEAKKNRQSETNTESIYVFSKFTRINTEVGNNKGFNDSVATMLHPVDPIREHSDFYQIVIQIYRLKEKREGYVCNQKDLHPETPNLK
ncbi:hypothetical protein ACJX0J_019659, partial [Zea mays]